MRILTLHIFFLVSTTAYVCEGKEQQVYEEVKKELPDRAPLYWNVKNDEKVNSVIVQMYYVTCLMPEFACT